MVLEQRVQLVAPKHAQHDGRERLDRMLHLTQDRALQTDKIARQQVVEDLAPAVLERLETEGPTGQQGEELLVARALRKDRAAGFDHQFAPLETRNEGQLLRGEIAEMRLGPERTDLAGDALDDG